MKESRIYGEAFDRTHERVYTATLRRLIAAGTDESCRGQRYNSGQGRSQRGRM